MATVFWSFWTSLDGFVAAHDDRVGPLFGWNTSGDVEIRPPGYPRRLRLSEAPNFDVVAMVSPVGTALVGRVDQAGRRHGPVRHGAGQAEEPEPVGHRR